MSSPASVPEAWAAYRQGVLSLAFVARGGPVYGALGDAPPSFEHPAVSARAQVLNDSYELLGLVEASTSVEDLCARLSAQGYQVRKVPLSALAWALSGVPLE